ncbi:zinc ribbon domain-containing protein [Sphingobium cupriresistens]|uniref:zinc ribbon domain-containing protein n=1 Tax=Sphingobium cupriresistens TaxID=1132417 RepID=UPI000AFB7C23|nr:hypothetical protein [Sphingobium cupriresistens]
MSDDLFATDSLELDDGIDLSKYIEQAEYLPPDAFDALTIDHPYEAEIVRKLASGGAKLLVGPRGCGKTTLMLRAYHKMARERQLKTLPVYVNFKLSLKLEPLYQTTPNATFWFRTWLILKIYEALHSAISLAGHDSEASPLPALDEVSSALLIIEAGDPSAFNQSIEYHSNELSEIIEETLSIFKYSRCVLLLDDAAHAFSPKQQEDFFDFFRRIKGQRIAPKAAIYPGITNLSPSFHVGHDAEQIDVWIRPDSDGYIDFMRGVAASRFGGSIPSQLASDPDIIPFLAYSAFGIPRAFLNMIRNMESIINSGKSSIDRRKIIEAAKQSRQDAHAVFDSLIFKLPMYKKFISRGDDIYTQIISLIKDFNRQKSLDNQGVEVAIRRPVSSELGKLIGFYQYAGLIMPSGENSRGDKGVFDIYFVHFADLVTENAIVGRRTKSLKQFVGVLGGGRHQAWPRINPDKLEAFDGQSSQFVLALPPCQQCGSERPSEGAKFCVNCGSPLTTASVYHSLVGQDIVALPITPRRAAKIKKHSAIRTVKDILLDSTKQELRGVPQIGPKWAERIFRYAEEYVA